MQYQKSESNTTPMTATNLNASRLVDVIGREAIIFGCIFKFPRNLQIYHPYAQSLRSEAKCPQLRKLVYW
jgi:hypothetical protein